MNPATSPLTITDVNNMTAEAFSQSVGRIFDHSPWIAAEAWTQRPYHSVDHLHHAMMRVIEQAGRQRQMALILAHPELGALRAAREALTAESRQEQTGAGFDQMSAEEAQQLSTLNQAYKARFGFPFIMAVKGRTRQEIIAAMEQRLHNPAEEEYARALSEVGKISRFRLHDLIKEQATPVSG